MTKKDKKVRNFLGLALIPQAGVAIGLAATGARTLGGEVSAPWKPSFWRPACFTS